VPFTDTGLFYVYAGVDLDAEEKVRRLIVDELMRMADTPLTERQLRSAQRQMIGQMAINDDFGMNEMQSIGKAYLSYDHVNTLEEMNADLMAVTPAELMRVAQECFNPKRFSTLVYGN
jgi:predicted Zn-dependent peptidase